MAAPRTINEAGVGAGPYRPYRGPQYYADSKPVVTVSTFTKVKFFQLSSFLLRAFLCTTPQYSCTVRTPWPWKQLIKPKAKPPKNPPSPEDRNLQPTRQVL
jgi:hypothetical protein